MRLHYWVSVCLLTLFLVHVDVSEIKDEFGSLVNPGSQSCFRGPWFMCLRKPKILVIELGGTIGATGSDPTNPTNYTNYNSTSSEDLANSIPEASDIAAFHFVTLSKKGSPDLTRKDILDVAAYIHEHRYEYHGFIITGGSDIAEKVVHDLDLFFRVSSPIVYVASARPHSALSADGPLNFVQAAQVISDPSSRGRGVLLICNEKVWGAYLLYKRTTNGIDMFDSPVGPLGIMKGGKPHFWYGPREHTGRMHFDITKLVSTKIVRVDTHYATETESIVTSLYNPEVAGVSIIGQGAGSMPTAGQDMISKASAENKDKPIVVCLMNPDGFVDYPMYGTGPWAIPGGFRQFLTCNSLAQLLLMSGKNAQEIRHTFEVDALTPRSNLAYAIRLAWFNIERVAMLTLQDCRSRLQLANKRLPWLVNDMKRRVDKRLGLLTKHVRGLWGTIHLV